MIHSFKHKFARIVTIMLIICLFASFNVCDYSYGASDTRLVEISAVDSITTGTKVAGNYVKLTVSDKKIIVEMQCQQDYDGLSPRLINYTTGKIVSGTCKYLRDESYNKGDEVCFEYDCSSIASGTYYFRICAQKESEADLGFTNYPTIFSGARVTITKGTPALYQYLYISSLNKRKTSALDFSMFCTPSMSDYKYYAFNKMGTKTPRDIDEKTESAYYKQISDSICEGIESDYLKALAIFEYVTSNLYYDKNANYEKREPYDDTYYNLKSIQEKTSNGYNAKDGKVAVQCDGYAFMFTVLARAQRIPTRVIFGRKIVPGTSSWETVTDNELEKNNHAWCQCLIDNKVISVDPQQGSPNVYGDSSSASKEWLHSDIIKYHYFDMPAEQLATSHYIIKFLPGNISTRYMTVGNEISQLKTFLSYNGNGKKISKKVSTSNTATWSTGNNTYTDGFGSLKCLNWPDYGLTGKLNLDNFKKLKLLYVYKNDITSISLKNCKELVTLKASGTKVTSLDASNCKKLTTLVLTYTKLKSVKFYAKSKVRTISGTKNGSFTFNYSASKSTPCQITTKSDIGYKLKGIYNYKTGKKLTGKQTYNFKADAATEYKIKFALDPGSFKYILREGNSSTLASYNLALQKRLKELGYYSGDLTGKFTSSTTKAVKKFQKKHGIKANGYVKEDTWKILFSTKAKKC